MSMSNDLVERAGKAFDKYIALYSRHRALEVAWQQAQTVQSTGQDAATTVYEKAASKLQADYDKGMKKLESAKADACRELAQGVAETLEAYEIAKAETEAWQAEVKETENILVGIPETAHSGGRTSLGRSL